MKRTAEDGGASDSCKSKEKSPKESPLCERIYDGFMDGTLTANLFSEVMVAESLTASELNVKVFEHAMAVGCARIPELFKILSDMAGEVTVMMNAIGKNIRKLEKYIFYFQSKNFLIYEKLDITESLFKKIYNPPRGCEGYMCTRITDMTRVLSEQTKRKYAPFLEFMQKEPLKDSWSIKNVDSCCEQCGVAYWISGKKSSINRESYYPRVCVRCLESFRSKSAQLEEYHLQKARLDFNSKALSQ